METVIAYYMPPEELGIYEKYEMQRIDFNEAAAHPKFGKHWTLTPPPEGTTIRDKTPAKINVATEMEAQASAPTASPPILKGRRQGLNPI
jgi:hypothetical protein